MHAVLKECLCTKDTTMSLISVVVGLSFFILFCTTILCSDDSLPLQSPKFNLPISDLHLNFSQLKIKPSQRQSELSGIKAPGQSSTIKKYFYYQCEDENNRTTTPKWKTIVNIYKETSV